MNLTPKKIEELKALHDKAKIGAKFSSSPTSTKEWEGFLICIEMVLKILEIE